jgi:hypothetical protein
MAQLLAVGKYRPEFPPIHLRGTGGRIKQYIILTGVDIRSSTYSDIQLDHEPVINVFNLTLRPREINSG